LVSGSRSTTSRSFMRQKINAARLPRQIRKCAWRNGVRGEMGSVEKWGRVFTFDILG
jgi:hypothetical protein